MYSEAPSPQPGSPPPPESMSLSPMVVPECASHSHCHNAFRALSPGAQRHVVTKIARCVRIPSFGYVARRGPLSGELFRPP